MRVALMVAGFSSCAALAEAGEAQSFRELTRKSWVECSWRADASSMPFAGAAALIRTRDCVELATLQAERDYRTVSGSLQSTLRPYYSAWRAGIEALTQVPYASRTVAERSIGESSKRLDEAWAATETTLQNPSLGSEDLAVTEVGAETPADIQTAENL